VHSCAARSRRARAQPRSKGPHRQKLLPLQIDALFPSRLTLCGEMSASTVSARQAGREAVARALEKGALHVGVRKSSLVARASLMSPPREGLADISNSFGCVRPLCRKQGSPASHPNPPPQARSQTRPASERGLRCAAPWRQSVTAVPFCFGRAALRGAFRAYRSRQPATRCSGMFYGKPLEDGGYVSDVVA